MTARDEITSALVSVVAALDEYHIPYFLTGSLAASAHGEFRATNDVNFVADFVAADLSAFVGALDVEFHADAEQAVSCVREGTSFNAIHRTSFLKVDFFPAVSPFNRSAIARAETLRLPGMTPAIRVATREDILLAKLRWYQLGGESSERQRRDIEGIVAMNQDLFERAYLVRWAADLGVTDLLRQFAGSTVDGP